MNCGFFTRFSHENRPLNNFSCQSISAKNKYFSYLGTQKNIVNIVLLNLFYLKKSEKEYQIEFHVAWYVALKLLLRIARNPIRDSTIIGYFANNLFTIYFVEDPQVHLVLDLVINRTV